MEADRRRPAPLWIVSLIAAAAVVSLATPVFALGHRGDSRHIAALRDGTSDGNAGGSGVDASVDVAPGGPATGAPEVDAGVIASAVVLIAGGSLIARARLRR